MILSHIKKIVICFIPLVIFLSGCATEKINTNYNGEIYSLSISQNSMDKSNCYSFFAHKNEDNYYLNAWCYIDSKEVKLEDISITKDEFDEFTKLDEKYDFSSLIKGEKKFKALDDTTKKFQVSYEDESINLNTNGECYEAVNSYFLQLAEKYSD